MRIISGRLKGRKLHTFRGHAVRPTPDRVREALFSILAQKVQNATVLDLFAGTGALGTEAISRGARSTLFIDNNTDALAILRKNIRHCGITASTRVIQWDISRNLNCLIGHAQPFNMVFMDPPYGRDLAMPALRHLLASDCLADGATIIIEHEPGLQWESISPPLRLTDSRRYGQTLIAIFSFTAPEKSI